LVNNDRDNFLYDGGGKVGEWQSKPMNPEAIPAKTNEPPMVKAEKYEAEIKNLSEVLIDYYVRAEDIYGNITRSPIRHVWIGSSGSQDTGSGDDGNNLFVLDGETDANKKMEIKNCSRKLQIMCYMFRLLRQQRPALTNSL